jgi:hypothetical protein
VQGIFQDRNMSLFEALEMISVKEALWSVSESCACIAAQVEHFRFHLGVL